MEDNYFAGVGAIVLKENKILLVRHTYGAAAGKLLNPGGMIQQGELPTDAVKREVLEETGINVNPVGMLSIRCAPQNWYMVFLAEYVSGEPKSDGCENSEALFMDCAELLQRDDATDTVKTLLKIALNKKPIIPADTGQNRLLFAANEDL
jgi:ADP-ribose pyrophosphatase YjhB (NUDIX family)